MLLFSAMANTAFAQTATVRVLNVGYQKKITMAVSGAVAAYSLDSKCIEASASDGIVSLLGAGLCDTRIVIVTGKGTELLEAHVVAPPPSYPPGFQPPEGTGSVGGVSHYEFRYLSDPAEIENMFDSVQRQGSFSTHLHLEGIAPFSPTATESPWSFPYLYYNVSTPRFGMTLFDQVMTNSPLTVDNTLVRGFHLRYGRWQFHAGYTSLFAFENVLLPQQKESVVGVDYRIPIRRHGSLTANFYSFGSAASDIAGQPGQVGSLVYEYNLGSRFDLLAEVGFSHKPGAAFHLTSSRVGDSLSAHLRYEPSRFAGLGLNNFHGLFGDLSWDHQWTDKLSSNFDLSEQRYNLPKLRQTNFVSQSLVRYRPVRQWTLSAGGTYSRFNPSTADFPKINSLDFPLGVSFDTLHFGTGFQYRYSHDSSENLGGQEFRGSIRGGGRGVYGSAFYDRQTQMPTLGFVMQQVPGLQQAMAELDLQATSSSGIAQLFQSNLALQNLGLLNGLAINLSPVRTQWGAGLLWAGKGASRQRVRLNFMDDHIETLTSAVATTTGTISYSRQLGFDNALNVSFSVYRTGLGGIASGIHPLAEIAFRHRFHSAPGWFMRVQRGVITGMVFQDKLAAGLPGAASRPLAGVRVILDGTRRTRTDSHGRYQFSRVPFGSHKVEVLFKSVRPFFYTTPSQVETGINSSVDFGITFAAGRLFGIVRNDAGAGVPNVGVIVASRQNRYHATTDDQGKFSIAGMENGTYKVNVDPNSLPAGYLLRGLKPVEVQIRAGTPAHVELTLQAVRSASGRVRWLDPKKGIFLPVPGIQLTIAALGVKSTTDAQGRYLFRHLAAGTWKIKLEINHSEYARIVHLGPGPAFRRNVDFNITSRETPETLTSLR